MELARVRVQYESFRISGSESQDSTTRA